MSPRPEAWSEPSDASDLRCAAQMRRAGADPIGTAGSYDGYVLVEWPRPWPADMADIVELAPLRDALSGRRFRVQGLVPEQADIRRVVLYRKNDGAFSGFRRAERSVHLADLANLGLALGAAAAELMAQPDPPTQPGQARVSDVLICTHGRRDRCCGSWGTELWRHLDAEANILGPGVRLWRTSHTGGHRFAPTMMVLPEGTLWAFADPAIAARVVRRDGPMGDVLAFYRGCGGLTSPPVQAMERAVLGRAGWSLLDTPRVGEELGGARVRLVVDPDGRDERWEATFRAGRCLPTPVCGSLPDAGATGDPEWEITDLTRTR